jgi:TatD DNase family protein
MGLADVHAHLTHPRLLEDVCDVIDRARAAGVTSIVCNGLNPGDNERVRALAQRFPEIRPAYGLYPVDAVLPEMRAQGVEYPREGPEAPAKEAVEWVRAHAAEAIAVGEIGLDGYWVPESLWHRQEEVFRELVLVGLELDKPLIIHTRKRERRTLEILQELGVKRVNWHCFGGKVNLARTIAEHGHYLSIPANARRSESFTRMVQTLPRDRILLETDCPYLSPERDQRNEPATVAGTARYVSELWGVAPAEVEGQLAENFERLFGVAP